MNCFPGLVLPPFSCFLLLQLFVTTSFGATETGSPAHTPKRATIEELITFAPPKGWVKVKAKAETPVRTYIPVDQPNSGLRISLAINEMCKKGLGPRQLGFKNIVRFFGMADRAVASAKKEGKSLRRDKFKCESVTPTFTFTGAKIHALKICRPFPMGSSYEAYVYRIAFSDEGCCYRLTFQGPEELVNDYKETVEESFAKILFKVCPIEGLPKRDKNTKNESK